MSLSVRLGAFPRRAGLRLAPRPRYFSAPATRPRLAPSSVVLSSLPWRRYLSDVPTSSTPPGPSSAPLVDHAASTSTISDAVSSSPEGTLQTAWEMAKTILSMPSDAVTQLLVSMPSPSYLVSVFAIAIALRSCLTFPVQVWQRKRIERLNKVVNPEIKQLNEKVAMEVLVDAKKAGWGYEEYLAEVKKKMKDGVYALHKKHKTHPIVTMLAPMAVNVPLLIAASWGIRNALVTHPEVAEATGLWLKNFGTPDSTGILEIATAMLAAGNIELMKYHTKVRKQLFGGVMDAEGEAEKAQAAAPEKLLRDTAAPSSSPAPASTPGPAPSSGTPSSSRVFAHRPTSPPATPSEKRGISSTPSVAKKARSRGPRPVSQIPSASRPRGPGSPSNPVEVRIPSSALRKKQPPMPGQGDMTNVSRSRAFDFAVKDKDRITKGLTNFFSVLSIAIVPIGLWTPSLVVFYWFSSLCFTNVQTAYFLSVDKKALKAKQEAAAQIKTQA